MTYPLTIRGVAYEARQEGDALFYDYPMGTLIIDLADYDLVKIARWSWVINPGRSRTIYFQATSGIPRKPTRIMHTYLIGKRPGLDVDHINRNGSDNRRVNLRHLTQQHNSVRCFPRRIGIPKGAQKHGKKWTAYIAVNNRTRYIGTFDTMEQAGAAYAAEARKHFGEHATY